MEDEFVVQLEMTSLSLKISEISVDTIDSRGYN